MADNTLQYEWIVTIKGGLDLEVADFVAGDLLWYPVEGDPKTRIAPDVLVAFGRPKGHRGSYRQWEEGGVAPQVVWEILSPGNTHAEMHRKHIFYQTYGVEEYYIYDPDEKEIMGWIRKENLLQPIPVMLGWVSPRLGIRFDLDEQGLLLFHRDGRRFLSFQQLGEKAAAEEARRKEAEERAQGAEARAQEALETAARERARAEALAAKFKELGLSL